MKTITKKIKRAKSFKNLYCILNKLGSPNKWQKGNSIDTILLKNYKMIDFLCCPQSVLLDKYSSLPLY